TSLACAFVLTGNGRRRTIQSRRKRATCSILPPVVDSPGQKMATSPLLQTKLYAPRSGPRLVPRPRLIQRLNQGTVGKLTVVSAPAGFGKTTLLAEWLATSEAGQGRAAWVALDQSDNEPALFWAYFIAA